MPGEPSSIPRRTFVKAAAIGVTGAALGVPVMPQGSARPGAPTRPPDDGAVRLGVASYSLRCAGGLLRASTRSI